MTHPMNSNPFPAAFVNFKGEIQVWPVSMPDSSSQCFLEWRMKLLTEQHAVAHMTQSLNDIMTTSLTSKSTLCNIDSIELHGLMTRRLSLTSGGTGSMLTPAQLR